MFQLNKVCTIVIYLIKEALLDKVILLGNNLKKRKKEACYLLFFKKIIKNSC